MSDIARPNRVLAPNPWGTDRIIELLASPETIRQYMEDGWLAKLGEFWGLVHGGNVTKGMLTTSRIFRGVKRPLEENGSDSDMYIYVTSHDRTYAYRETRDGGGFVELPRPTNSVFVVFAEIAPDGEVLAPRNREEELQGGTIGIVRGWEWTPSDPKAPDLPNGYRDRYTTEIPTGR